MQVRQFFQAKRNMIDAFGSYIIPTDVIKKIKEFRKIRLKVKIKNIWSFFTTELDLKTPSSII